MSETEDTSVIKRYFGYSAAASIALVIIIFLHPTTAQNAAMWEQQADKQLKMYYLFGWIPLILVYSHFRERYGVKLNPKEIGLIILSYISGFAAAIVLPIYGIIKLYKFGSRIFNDRS